MTDTCWAKNRSNGLLCLHSASQHSTTFGGTSGPNFTRLSVSCCFACQDLHAFASNVPIAEGATTEEGKS